jgi:hypothetical protein
MRVLVIRLFVIVAFLTSQTCYAQEPEQQTAPPPAPTYAPQDMPVQTPQSAPQSPQSTAVQQPVPPAGASGSITVPQGTRIPLVLTTPINTHSTHPGDAVRAETSFPVTIDTQLAIPAGTYAEGQITSVHRPNSSNRPAFQMRFTRLIFANGYAVQLSGATAEAMLANPAAAVQVGNDEANAEPNPAAPADLPDINALAFAGDGSNPDEVHSFSLTPVAFAFRAEPQQTPVPPTLPPLPKVGPSKGLVIGIGLGVLAGVLVITAIVAHHHPTDLYLDAGSKFDLILQSPLTLEAASIPPASATPASN